TCAGAIVRPPPSLSSRRLGSCWTAPRRRATLSRCPVPCRGPAAMNPAPPADESRRRLHRAGWSVGEYAAGVGGGERWHILGFNGENVLDAKAATQSEAWHRACSQAGALGMLRRGP